MLRLDNAYCLSSPAAKDPSFKEVLNKPNICTSSVTFKFNGPYNVILGQIHNNSNKTNHATYVGMYVARSFLYTNIYFT